MKTASVVAAIIGVAVIAYLPIVDNFFISDDFTLMAFVTALDQNPMYILEAPSRSEFFRLVSYVYFWACLKFFGLNSALYYWANIGLHVAASLLVYVLVRNVAKQRIAALAAAVFFAAYERHQEAVMWISAANETILTIGCLLFLIAWERYVSRTESSKVALVTSLAIFAVALFSKEAAVAMLPMAFAIVLLHGGGWREAVRKTLPLLLMTVGFLALWLSQAHRNFFVTDQHYAFGTHFFGVYGRSLVRLLSQAVVFVIPLLVLKRTKDYSGTRWLRDRSFLFFTLLLLAAIGPYSFLTYLDHIPSRNTYLPSVGLAGMVGLLFAALHGEAASQGARRLCSAFLLAVVSLNGAYLWIKKEPQYLERAAPTTQLISALNDSALDGIREKPIYICGFPLHPWIGSEAIVRFTRMTPRDVVFADSCRDVAAHAVVQWNQNEERYAFTLAQEVKN